MMRKLTILFYALLATSLTLFAQPSTVTVGNTTLDVRVVIQGNNSSNGIDIPWEIQWGPDDYIWMTERSGRVSRLDPVTGTRTTILDLSSSIYDNSESGLLGMQLHPDFGNTPHVFLVYTYFSGGIKERIVRYDYNSSTQQLENPFTLIEGINGNTTHIGCRLLILPDNTLLATTGDYQNTSSPQNMNSLSGKVLRMNLDGTVPSDNPFGSNSYVYSLGHRNAQGLLLAPNGKIYSSEHGPSTNDEFNIIVPGGNYGWPSVEGFCNESGEMTACNNMTDYQDPIAIWYENSTIAVSDIVWYDHPAIPEWRGKVLMAVLKAEHIKSIELDTVNGTSVVDQEIHFNSSHANNPGSSFNQGQLNRLRDLCVAPDGRVFVATSGSSWANTSPFTHSILELKNSDYSPVGLVDAESHSTIVFPNPSVGPVNMVFANEVKNGTYSIVDHAGRVMMMGAVTSRQMKLDLSELAPGMYIVRARNGEHLTTERVALIR